MTLKPSTGPWLLVAGGAVLLACALAGAQPLMIVFAGALVGLGFWALRGADLGRLLTGPVLLAASALSLLAAGLVSGQFIMFAMAAAAACLAWFAWQRAND
jgi:hypothetical protein